MIEKQISPEKQVMKENFNPSSITDEMRATVTKLAHLKAQKTFLEEIENSCGEKVLSENVIYGSKVQTHENGNIVRNEEDNSPIFLTYRVLNPKEEDNIYRYGEENFGNYLQLHTKELKENGIYKKSYELGASLVVSTMISDLQRDFIKQLEPLTGIKNEQLYILDNRRKFLELSEKLVASTMDEDCIKSMEKTFLTIEPILEFDNKIRIDTNLKRNDSLADFSKSITDLIKSNPQDEALSKLVSDFDKKDSSLNNMDEIKLNEDAEQKTKVKKQR